FPRYSSASPPAPDATWRRWSGGLPTSGLGPAPTRAAPPAPAPRPRAARSERHGGGGRCTGARGCGRRSTRSRRRDSPGRNKRLCRRASGAPPCRCRAVESGRRPAWLISATSRGSSLAAPPVGIILAASAGRRNLLPLLLRPAATEAPPFGAIHDFRILLD